VLLAAILCPAAAQKRPVTLDDVTAPRQRNVRSKAVWSSDGSRLAFTEHNAIWQYEVRSDAKKEIVSLARLREKAVKPPSSTAFDWQNRRVSESSLQWSNAGDAMLVAEAGDLFLVKLPSGDWTQLTNTAAAERDPKLSPDGRRVAFRRGSDLYS